MPKRDPKGGDTLPPGTFFETPDAVIDRIIDRARNAFPGRSGPTRILEPSAGRGAILSRAFEEWPEATAVAVESDPTLANVLRARFDARANPERIRIVEHDFLMLSPLLLGQFDLVLMTPPFAVAGRPDAWLDHCRHAMRFLKGPGSMLVGITPVSIGYTSKKSIASFRMAVAARGGHAALPADAFEASGITASAAIIHLEGQDPADPAVIADEPAPQAEPQAPGATLGDADDRDPTDRDFLILINVPASDTNFAGALGRADEATLCEALSRRLGHEGHIGRCQAITRRLRELERAKAAALTPSPKPKARTKAPSVPTEQPTDLVVEIFKYRGKLVFPGNFPDAVRVGTIQLPTGNAPVINGKENRLYLNAGDAEGYSPGGLLVAARTRMFGIALAEAK